MTSNHVSTLFHISGTPIKELHKTVSNQCLKKANYQDNHPSEILWQTERNTKKVQMRTLTNGKRIDHVYFFVYKHEKLRPYNIIFVHSSSYDLQPDFIILLDYNVLERN